jgi:hypothetical protein
MIMPCMLKMHVLSISKPGSTKATENQALVVSELQASSREHVSFPVGWTRKQHKNRALQNGVTEKHVMLASPWPRMCALGPESM